AGTGVGVNALLSRNLGEKNFTDANKAATSGILLFGISALLFAAFGLSFSRFFFETQTDIPYIVENGTAYLTIICTFSFGIFGQIIFERLLQSTGKTIYSMYTQATGAIINLILDPIMIFGLFGFPRLEVAGAALATVIGQICALCLGLIFNLKCNKEISLNFKKYKPSGRIIKRIYAVGIPSIIMQSIGSVMTFTMNQILMGFTKTAAAVFGVYFKLQSFVFMPIFGMNNGMIPIIAYNLGADKKDRMMKTYKLGVMYAMMLMLIGLIVMQFFPGQLLSIFDASPEMLSIGIPALRIISLHFLLAGFCIITTSLFQAIGNGVISMVISIVRQLVVLLPAAYLLSLLGNVNYVWFAFCFAESSALIMCLLYLRRIRKTVLCD
ncbi:MAG: MATE family efflux transporter, partial [Clostridia bacterium]|nr:MATE family efflux transporter [Clostridia bacterium]